MTTFRPNSPLLAIVLAISALSAGSAFAAPVGTDSQALGATCAKAKNCIDFETAAWTYTPFGAYNGATMTATTVPRLPASSTNLQAVQIDKSAGAELWAGVTISSGPNNTVPPMLQPNTATKLANETITMGVYSDTVGRNIKLKIESTANGAFVEVDMPTTKANTWETIKFDFSMPTAGAYSSAEVYDRISVFPGFGHVPTATETTTIDNIVYTKAKAPQPCNSGGKQQLVNGQFASDYSVSSTAECGSYGFYAGADDTLWWNGYANAVQAGGHPSQYFGYGTVQANTWGVGGFVKAPKDGVVVVDPNSVNPADHYLGMNFELWGNDELMNTHPALTILLKSGQITLSDGSLCTPVIQTTVNAAAPGVQSYSVAFSGFTVAQACAGTNSVSKILAKGVKEFHAQVLKTSLYTNGGDTAGRYPNGLNMGKITFTY